ncbi:MAG: response regulator [Motiliproteus sp.]
MKIAAYGFADDQNSKLGRILKLSRTNPYRLVEFDPNSLPDLLLVFGHEQLQQTPITELPSGYLSRLILVDKRKSSVADHPHIGYPLISSRVLQALDRLTSANEESFSSDEASDAESSDNCYDKYIAEAGHQPATVETPANADYRVLVVDDSEPMQKCLAKELRSQFPQIEIDFADAGEPALEMARQQHYDFIFLDIMMPGIDGFETCTLMREIERLKKTPIIMLSSKTSPLDEVKGIMAGSSTYLTKPIESEEFQKVMGRICRWIDNFRAA